MGILSAIFSKIFPASHPANTATTDATAPVAASAASSATPAAGSATSSAATASAAPAAAPPVDIEAVLSQMAGQTSEKLNWQTSIVDLLKLLGLDSSLQARKQLAQELHFTGNTNDSASMNIWLHREVMNQVAANGGKVPADLMQ